MEQIATNLSKQTGMSSVNQQKLVEHLNFLLNNAIIPLLETKDDVQFDLKYDQAVKQYFFYTIQIMYLFGYNKINEEQKPDVNKSFLIMLDFIRNDFSNVPDKNIRSQLLESIDNMEDYLLFASDQNIGINEPQYGSAIEYSSGIWICIFALYIALNDQKYSDKIDIIIKKCQEASKMLKDSVMKIAKDHGRIFSDKTINVLNDIESNKIKTITQSVDEFLMDMDKEINN
jgi:hypothetical protein